MAMAWRVLAIAGIVAWAVHLFLHDPEHGPGFLPCPFHWVTGLFCPGCGSQRALHDLLHGRVVEGFGHNALLVIALPLLGIQWVAGRWRSRPLSQDNRIVWAWGIGITGWWLLRNLPGMEALAP